MNITLIIVVITVLVSLAAFSNSALLNKLILWPRVMNGRPAEYYRFLTSGFIHGDYMHLFFNMFTMFSFGRLVETVIAQLGVQASSAVYIFMYLSAIIIADLPAFIKHRNNSYYRALGASGGVSALVAFSIFYFPWENIYLFGQLGIPSILYGVIYVIYSAAMSKRGNDNIGHDAHLWGTAYGFIFAAIVDPSHGMYFIQQLAHPRYVH